MIRFVRQPGTKTWSPCLKPETLEKMIFVHANTKLIDKVTDVCYVEPNVSWQRDSVSTSSDDDTESESESGTDDSDPAVAQMDTD